MGRSSHFTSGGGGSLVPLAEPVPCDVVGVTQEAPRQTARSAAEWTRIVFLAMCIALARLPADSSAQRREAWIKSDFPQVTVWILEVACVAAIERWLRRFDDLGARLLCLTHGNAHFLLR